MSEFSQAEAGIPEVVVADAGRGGAWLTDAFALFMRAPGPWLLVGIVFIVGCIALAMIPFIGQLLLNVAMPLFVAGVAVAARNVDAGNEFRSEDVTEPFSAKAEKLLILGVIYMGISIGILILIMLLVFVLAGATIGASLLSGAFSDAATSVGVILGMAFLALLALALYLPLMMAMWFAPLLVHFHGLEPMAAMKLSFSACLKNFVPFLLYGIVAFIALIVAAIPFFLGFFLLVPVLFLSVYTGYKDVFAHR
jgi:hypothetical protein